MLIRALFANGIGQYELNPPLGLTASTADDTWANRPQPWQQKTPSATSIAGSSDSSHQARKIMVRQCSRAVVNQMWVITPDPLIMASSRAAPASMLTDGEIFHPIPRSRAASAPVPAVARAPPARAPSGFSALIDRVSMSRSRLTSYRPMRPTVPQARRTPDHHCCCLQPRRRWVATGLHG